jgi:NAD(P)H-dependent FMN reductase
MLATSSNGFPIAEGIAQVIKLVGIAGSLRRQSFNGALLAAAAQSMPEGAQLEIVPIRDIPLYNADVEAESGIPAAVMHAKDALTGAQGLVIATPEYNGGIPGVAKNALDWMSRPSQDIPRVFHGKWVALMGATPGGFGTVLAQAGWLQVLRTLRMRLWTDAGPFYLSHAAQFFDSQRLADTEQRTRLVGYMAAYVDRIRAGTG